MPCSRHTHTHTHTHTHIHTQNISGCRHKNLLVRPMKDSRYWSDISTTIDENYIKNFCQSVQEKQREEKVEEKYPEQRS